ncbi:hypothetical protein Bandiella_00143 [Candidatus Bandiella woodruffii]|uniref:Outer membrane protein n=2 Tax=Candidatus Bandiella euplotis TaxID=1664265 RepID=A0ABZ0UIX3_9RICK|nr:hypothetical protein Bandiella_00143 [Candidatus Bandiella woodruffii]
MCTLKIDLDEGDNAVHHNNGNYSQLNKEDVKYIQSNQQISEDEKILLRNAKVNMNFVGVGYDLGLRTLLYKKANQRASFDVMIGLPPAIQGAGGAHVFHPSLKFGAAYARSFDMGKMKGNFFEVMSAAKLHSKIKNNELFFAAILGLKISDKTSLIFTFENNYSEC